MPINGLIHRIFFEYKNNLEKNTMIDVAKAMHIDFVLRSDHPNANMPKGQWFITEIQTYERVSVWRKTSRNDWIRVAKQDHRPYEEEYIKSGLLIKWGNGIVCAAGATKERLDGILKDYMEKNGFNKKPYIYW